MKKTLLLLILSVMVFACKNNTELKEETETVAVDSTEARTYQGEFIFTEDVAVFKGSSFIYGVAINDLAKDLAKRVEAVKKEDYDMVPVVVRGKVTKKPEGAEGWDDILTITQIVTVSDTPTKADIQLKENKS